jgi:hypothetical protein
MPALRTEVTEIVTGLGTLGAPTLDDALAAGPPAALRNVDAATWDRLREAHRDGGHRGEFLAAWNNGRAFLRSADGLRDRVPAIVEWKGGHRDPGDDVVPSDLRIDHVYLVSCKYLSRVLHNAAPWALFDRGLAGATGPRQDTSWFDAVAPVEHQQLYQVVRRTHAGALDLPEQVTALSSAQRKELRRAIPRDWSPECADAYRRLAVTASERSAARWRERLASPRERVAMLWRLLRLGAAPYFVLGTGPRDSLRLRVATPWDWRAAYDLRSFDVDAEGTGQPRVRWGAVVRDRDAARDVEVAGHVEIRWSHGRFGGLPEAKVYLDTPHQRVPGYFPLV